MSIPAESRLHQAEWLRDKAVQEIFALLDGQNGRTRAVGGIVRDTILERLTAQNDIDMATELVPEEVLARAKAAGIAAYPTGIEHGTVTLRHGDVGVEVTTLRQDVVTDGRHAVVEFGLDWLADAERRDFTLNALYVDMNGALFDPISGIGDCLSGHVRFIGDAEKRIAEDGLRVFRFFRFSASHGQQNFDGAGLAACGAAAGRLSHLSHERVGAEMRRMFELPRIAVTLAKMRALNLLTFPEQAIGALQNYERQAGKPQCISRMALVLGALPAKELQRQWRLSNNVLNEAQLLRKAAALIAEMKLHEAGYRYPAAINAALDVAAAEAGWGRPEKRQFWQVLKRSHQRRCRLVAKTFCLPDSRLVHRWGKLWRQRKLPGLQANLRSPQTGYLQC
ncbi:CCA tRNA nucleotidyltransferase [Devosia rhodophyticola]|uniref:CCA tRNA nucleotidyltransferase n=1 Tax=Devosia rhodophyticola TaxID=3026423 RepID=A0ABY7YW20_9HYPH|nr:CCA tRNA nucleotidyltransferase [Devosia rhodophyticola]WDR05055.1 CCA tRNA nucleotidyltransferase [Devosia rhodophyticola]